MDTQTSNRLYDELAVTVGMRLIDMGVHISDRDVDVLCTDQDRDSGVERATALGRLAIDTGDLDVVRDAIESQDDRIRSIMSMSAPNDHAFAVVHGRDLADARLRRQLLESYARNDRQGMGSALSGIMDLHRSRR